LPDGITDIGSEAFFLCSSLKSVNIPAGVSTLKRDTFYSCSFEEIIIPETVTSIENGVFSNCRFLEKITLPNSIAKISNSLFFCCESLKEIHFPTAVQEIGALAFAHTPITSITIPDGVTVIASQAFYNCTSLEEIALPNSIKRIDQFAFANCIKLKDINSPENLTDIGKGAFSNCYALTSFTIPQSMLYMQEETFLNCSSLTDVTLPAGLVKIWNRVFYGCTSLQSIVIPKHVDYIGSNAFGECSSLQTAICEGNAFPGMPSGAFPSQTVISLSNPIPLITDLWHNLFLDGSDQTTSQTNSSPKVATLKNGIVTAHKPGTADFSFKSHEMNFVCRVVVKTDHSLSLPMALGSIGKKSFKNVHNIERIMLSKHCITIDDEAFAGNPGLLIVYMPDSVTEISDTAFENSQNVHFICTSYNHAADYAEQKGIPYIIVP